MSYSLSLQRSGQEQQSSSKGSLGRKDDPPRRFSLSTPGEVANGGAASAAGSNFSRPASLSADEEYIVSDHLQQLSISNRNGQPPYTSTRVDRLLHQRKLSRSRSLFQQDNEAPAADVPNHGSYNGLWERGDGWLGRDILTATSKLLPEGPDDVRDSSRQRLLVVANRLPVSATRQGHTWSLEVSAGGLVSALLDS